MGDRPGCWAGSRCGLAWQIEFRLPRPAWSPGEQFHRAVTESLEEWWHLQGGRFEAVTVWQAWAHALTSQRAGITRHMAVVNIKAITRPAPARARRALRLASRAGAGRQPHDSSGATRALGWPWLGQSGRVHRRA